LGECPYDPDYQGKDQILPIMGPVDGIYTDEELHHIRMLYAEKVTMVDTWAGYLLDNIKRFWLEDETLIVFISDHGEPMGKGEHGHDIVRKCSPWLYEEPAHIPVIMKGHGLPSGERVASFVHSCDIAPTVTDWMGLGIHRETQGKSLLPLMKGEIEKVWDFAIAGYHKYSWSIITDDWSYIHWLKEDEPTFAESIYKMYGVESAKAAPYLAMEDFQDASPGSEALSKDTALSEEQQMHRDAATLDGEYQWTCTPGSIAEVPERDELYDRKIDPFQLNNVVDQHPEAARELLRRLKEFMSELCCT